MSKAGRNLQVGDEALTDFNGNGLTLVKITKRIDDSSTGSRIGFKVIPLLKGGTPDSIYDADWFEPSPASLI